MKMLYNFELEFYLEGKYIYASLKYYDTDRFINTMSKLYPSIERERIYKKFMNINNQFEVNFNDMLFSKKVEDKIDIILFYNSVKFIFSLFFDFLENNELKIPKDMKKLLFQIEKKEE